MIIPFLMCVFWALIRDLQFEDQDSANCKWVFPTRENSESAKHARRPRRRASQKVQVRILREYLPNLQYRIAHNTQSFTRTFDSGRMTDLLWYILVSDFLLMQFKGFGNNVGVVVVAQSTESHSCSTNQN
jgi:hypothetical protein